MKTLAVIFVAVFLVASSVAGQNALSQPIPAVNTNAGCSSGQVIGNVSSSMGCINALAGATQALSAKIVTISTIGDQGTIVVPSYITKYSVSSFVVTNCTATPILAQVAIWTAAGGTGTNVVGAATITAASSTSAIVPMTVTATNTALSAGTLFVRIAVANVAAITCDFYAVINNLS